MLEEHRRGNTHVVAFRVPSEIIDYLERMAKTEKVSINIVANRILTSHMELNAPARATGMFLFPKRMVSAMLNKLDDESIKELGKQMARNDLIDLAYFKNGGSDINSFMSVLLAWARHSDFPVQDMIKTDMRTLVVKHEMGQKWSLFLSECLQACFNHFKLRVIDRKVPNDVLIFQIEWKD